MLETAMDESLENLWIGAEFVALGTPSVPWVPFHPVVALAADSPKPSRWAQMGRGRAQ